MELYVLHLDTNKKVQIWNASSNEVVAQMFDNGKKSRKSRYKLREYNNRKYFICLGHRYYLDTFTKIEI